MTMVVGSGVPGGAVRAAGGDLSEVGEPLRADDPQRVGAYQLLRVLGRGGMGTVYLARTPGLVPVAIKVPRPALAGDSRFQHRFRLEVQAVQQLPAPLSAGFVDAGVSGQDLWLCMEYIDGRSIEEQVRQGGPLPVGQVLRVGVALAETVRVLHAKGWVHRDIKPANVMLRRDGHPRLIDFGIIAHVLEELDLTGTDENPGSRRFMAPEQLGRREVSYPADIYSLALTLYFAATGHYLRCADHDLADARPRFEARDAAGRPVAVPGPRLPMIEDSGLRSVLTACLEVRPERRPEAAELLELLRRLVGELGEESNPEGGGTSGGGGGKRDGGGPGDGRRLPEPVRRRPRRVAIALAAGLLLTGAGAFRVMGTGATAVSECPAVAVDGQLGAVRTAASGECFGLLDAAPVDEHGGAGFGSDPQIRGLQAQLFAGNRAAGAPAPQDLTVVWLGALTCPPTGSLCRDGEYEPERQELQGLRLAQARRDLPAPGGHLRVVVANGGAKMAQVGRVVEDLLARRERLGSRLVVIGGSDSREATKAALTSLVEHGVPVVAPTLSADGAGGGALIDRPGYIQLMPPNHLMAEGLVEFLRTRAGLPRPVVVYADDDRTDLYTTNLRDDLVDRLTAAGLADKDIQVVTPREHVPPSVCRASGAGPGTASAALVFASRWYDFDKFVRDVGLVCPQGPGVVVANTSASRKMTDDAFRNGLRAPWPIAYFSQGAQCAELTAAAQGAGGQEARTLLELVRAESVPLCDPARGNHQVGGHVSLFWDAVALAQKVIPAGGSGVGSGGVPRWEDVDHQGTGARLTVRGGQGDVNLSSVRSSLVCTLTVDLTDRSGRSVSACDKAFPTVAK